MKQLLPLLTIAMLFFCSCKNQDQTILDESRTFTQRSWNRVTPEVFTVDIKNAQDYYNIDFQVIIDTTIFNQQDLPLTVNIYSPRNERRFFYSTIVLKQNGRWRGTVVTGKRVIDHRAKRLFSFNSVGAHRMEIGQATVYHDLIGVESLQTKITRASLD